MSNLKFALLLLLFFLSQGQMGMGFAGNISDPNMGEIQPVHQEEDGSYPSSAGYLLNTASQSESAINHLSRLTLKYSGSNSNEEEVRNRVHSDRFKRKSNTWLTQAEIIVRSLTFWELIYPHHFHF